MRKNPIMKTLWLVNRVTAQAIRLVERSDTLKTKSERERWTGDVRRFTRRAQGMLNHHADSTDLLRKGLENLRGATQLLVDRTAQFGSRHA